MRNIKIMAHLVAGYPDEASCIQAIHALADAGVEIAEIQIPFSDPTADGEVITRASQKALEAGFRVRDIWRYIDTAKSLGFEEVHVMTYGNIVYRWGIKSFLEEMHSRGITGVIVPDLPLEDDDRFYAAAREIGIGALPVAVPNMTPQRKALLKSTASEMVYAALRQGVTGRSTDITGESREFLRSLDIPKIYAGFGISSREQVRSLEQFAYAAVIGSHITRALGSGRNAYESVRDAVELCI